MKRTLLLLIFTHVLIGQAPSGYYNATMGLSGTALQEALHDIIDDHNQQSYTALWTHFQATDKKPNGKVWDMYSDVPGGSPAYEFTFGVDQDNGTGGTAEGQKYNREHSWPRSWFATSSTSKNYPMYSDLFHLVPSDKFVNAQRANFPYGEVNSPTWTSTNGSKLGANTYPGYTGTVFEPIDAYKGDFARGYLYMTTRYLNEDTGWEGSPMTNGAQLQSWALNLILDWHGADTVSQKEIDRNNAIYGIQGNRNPFIDHPEFADIIWRGGAPVSIEEMTAISISTFQLLPAFPNPFNGSTIISVHIPRTTPTSIDIFDLQGKWVSNITDQTLTTGEYQFFWSGQDHQEQDLASGIYLIRVSSADRQEFQRITLLR
ncbi:MAG: endonuclease [Candidatus Marinimicrobia bacterium]|nr:endonuclease [Candidatus Neomarinimicrobiota bacterium]MCF7904786.1 endonuclease [Candidatus Neomarinimicrobiota bacterium]